MIWLTCRAQLLVPTGGGRNLSALCCRARSTHTQPPTPIHLGRPPMSRLWASTAAEPRRVLTARRLEIWPRRFAWLHLDFSCRCAAQLLRMEFAVGAMPSLRRSEPGRRRAAIDADLLRLIFGGRPSSWIFWPCDDHQLMPNASRPTSGSRSSTSGRRSTSRRSARSPQWTPERARLPRQRCLAADRVTVACACVRPVAPTALGRSHPVGAAESGH